MKILSTPFSEAVSAHSEKYRIKNEEASPGFFIAEDNVNDIIRSIVSLDQLDLQIGDALKADYLFCYLLMRRDGKSHREAHESLEKIAWQS